VTLLDTKLFAQLWNEAGGQKNSAPGMTDSLNHTDSLTHGSRFQDLFEICACVTLSLSHLKFDPARVPGLGQFTW